MGVMIDYYRPSELNWFIIEWVSGSDWPGGLPGDSRWAGGPVGMVGRLAGWPEASKKIMIYYFGWPLMLSIMI